MIFCQLQDLLDSSFTDALEWDVEVWHGDQWQRVRYFIHVGDYYRVFMDKGSGFIVTPDVQICMRRTRMTINE